MDSNGLKSMVIKQTMQLVRDARMSWRCCVSPGVQSWKRTYNTAFDTNALSQGQLVPGWGCSGFGVLSGVTCDGGGGLFWDPTATASRAIG